MSYKGWIVFLILSHSQILCEYRAKNQALCIAASKPAKKLVLELNTL